jgi:hypothetical protein
MEKSKLTINKFVRFGPEMNNGKNVFVYGSNKAGKNGLGAALVAKLYWGAKTGLGEGRSGFAYAIPTKDEDLKILDLSEISESIKRFIEYANKHPDNTFLVTRVGCGLSRYDDKDIGPLFKGAGPNCILPDGWGK